MRRPTTEEAQSVAYVAGTEGWRIIENAIQEDIDIRTKQLVSSDFSNIADMARLQGEITALDSVIKWVKARITQVSQS